jgi:hypothetical protein
MGDEDFLRNYISGNYLLIGKSVDSDKTYHGNLSIRADNSQLRVTRNLNGESVDGNATIESTSSGDRSVLRIRFMQNHREYEETCLFQSDLDNYPRISCYLYQPGKNTDNPGLEAFFHDHGQ